METINWRAMVAAEIARLKQDGSDLSDCGDAIFESVFTQVAKDRHREVLLEMASERSLPWFVREYVAEWLDPALDGEALARLATEDEHTFVRDAAVCRLDPVAHAEVLAAVLRGDKDWWCRRAAVRRIPLTTHAELIAATARHDPKWEVRVVAAERMTEALRATSGAVKEALLLPGM